MNKSPKPLGKFIPCQIAEAFADMPARVPVVIEDWSISLTGLLLSYKLLWLTNLLPVFLTVYLNTLH